MQMNRESPKGLVTELRGRNGVTEMKVKHFLSGATLLSAALLLNAPLSAAVESDTVGYTTIEMQAGKWYQIGTPFVELDEETVPTLNTVFAEGFGEGDVAYILGPNGTYLPMRMWTTYNNQTGWFNTGIAEYDDMELAIGQAVFFSKKVDGRVTMKGRVAEISEIPFGSDSANSWSQIVRSYPDGDRSVNEMEWSGVEEGDMLYLFNSESGTYLPTRQWATLNGKTGWFNVATATLDDQKFAPHQAFFINKKSKGQGYVKAREVVSEPSETSSK